MICLIMLTRCFLDQPMNILFIVTVHVICCRLHNFDSSNFEILLVSKNDNYALCFIVV